MSTNYYWKKLPPELQEIYDIDYCDTTRDGPLLHIGHTAGAGAYCVRCGTTLQVGGSRYLHMSPKTCFDRAEAIMAKQCPVCGKTDKLEPHYSFTITIWKHMDILKSCNQAKLLIEDEYGSTLTADELLRIINEAQAIFQDPSVWS